MGKSDFSIVAVFYHRENLLPNEKTVGRVSYSGNGNCVNGNQRRNTAADVHKTAELLQMSDAHFNNVAAAELVQVIQNALLLRKASGKDCRCNAVFL